ncbi:hypothetical protein Q4493_15900 [Colwellia sp. 1_MG-2023]|uniref:hypothetical protein n=1 Tax=Colwellia sp. 1_MG-2023 TaxID=3062649 RepID=UPI0026E4874D|nr:hypothetical protein [Colwellia sp. 1_MG-2023]MDO6447253.1 hypothetical protein [Colwellia sp. 1_MG-2023]
MSHIYDYFTNPSEFSVMCPKCENEALFETPSDPIEKQMPSGGLRIIRNNVHKKRIGLYKCSSCGTQGKTTISWPNDAYYKAEIKGKLFWAWNRDNVIATLSFVTSKHRDKKDYPESLKFLMHLPSHFISAKNRPDAIKKLTKLLGNSA